MKLGSIGKTFLAFLPVLLSVEAAAANPRPNIVLLLVEDLSPRLGSFGDDAARTPNLDALASEGIRFTNAFTPAPVCAPSRAALFTGLYPQSFGAQNMRTTNEAVPPAEVKAFPEILRANGYFTINQGKMDYQFGNPTSMWDENGPDASLKDRDPDAPFFAVLQNSATHESRLFNRGPWARLKGLVKTGLRCLPCARAMFRRFDPKSVEVPPFLPDTPEVRAEIARLYSNVSVMDAWVGQQMKELRTNDLLDDTIVIWTTDHGDGIPRGKRSLYDSGLHVPMIVRYPDVAGMGTENDDLISFVDLPSMILQMANVEVPEYLRRDGTAETPFPARDYVYGGIDRMDEVRYRSRMMRSREFKYIRNFERQEPVFGAIAYRERLDSMSELRRLWNAGGLAPEIARYFDPPPEEELYDVRADPFEMRNLAADPQYAETLERYRSALAEWLDSIDDLSWMPESEMFHFLWNGDSQPRTSSPEIEFSEGAGGASVSIRSATDGASIEYRFPLAQDSRWKLYTKPVEVTGRVEIEARAVRYGFVPSDVVHEALSYGRKLVMP